MFYRYRFLIIILATTFALPLSNFAGTVDPKSDCPKKKKNQQEDSVGVYESENKVLEEVQISETPRKQAIAKKTPAKTTYKTFNSNLDESDKITDGDPNSAMSFNFIYYIIDKFKFADPLE